MSRKTLFSRSPLALLLCALFFPPRLAHASAPQGEAVNGFPNWGERVLHEWTNRARCDPAVEMSLCGAPCMEGACYSPKPPLPWILNLNRSARFHCDEMVAQNFFTHDSHCTLPSNINSLYPGSCSGAASCACVNGMSSCQTVCTSWSTRISMFGSNATGEAMAYSINNDPVQTFYLWLYESHASSACGFTPFNGHRWLLLMSSGGMGAGFNATRATIDFGTPPPPVGKIPSGSHYPRQAATVEAWANWYDTAGPLSARVIVDGTSYPMSLERGTPQNGAYSASISGVGSGCHRYYFVFQDSAGTTFTYPGTGSLGIGPGTCADWDTSRPPFAQGVYCTAKVNSLGCLPSIGFSGTPSTTSPQPFTISAVNVVNQKLGIVFYGYSQVIAPFQGGTFCAGTPVRRTPVQNSNGNALPAADCSGIYSFNFNAWIQGGNDAQLTVGQEVDAQCWSRDPASPSTTGLTDAVSFHVGP